MDTGENGGKEGCVWVGFLVEEEQKGLFLSQSPFFCLPFFLPKKRKAIYCRSQNAAKGWGIVVTPSLGF